MKISDYFVEHPKFAWVIAIVMILVGAIAIAVLPVSQYPQITPPQIIVQAQYPGADAQTLTDTVAVPIENQLNGVEGMLYMSSSATDSGVYTLTITFNIGVDPDMAQVKVENRLEQAKPYLPAVVSQEGLSVISQSANVLAFLVLESPGGTYDGLYLGNYAYTRLQNPLARIAGISDVNIYGPKDSMRIWLDPHKMQLYQLNTDDVIQALESQNAVAGIGALGSAPGPGGKQVGSVLLSLTTQGLLKDAAAFNQIVLKTDKNGGIVRLQDVARVEIGADTYTLSARYNNAPSVAISLSQTPDSNALQIMKNVHKEMETLSRAFGPDMRLRVAYDSTLFVRDSIQGILYTLLITFGLVIGVVYLFLQDVRATLIPSICIPVSLIATFMVIYALGFDINILTLFALILAIGLVVDDAIIVVERVQYLIQYKQMPGAAAAVQAMKDIGSSIIATTFVLLAIFIPVGMMAGITGKIYQQFAITISTAVLFSAVNALTLSPMLCAVFLRPKPAQGSDRFFQAFNRLLSCGQDIYLRGVRFLCTHLVLTGCLTVGVVGSIVWLFLTLPSSFIPQEDQGFILANVQLPETASFAMTQERLSDLTERVLKQPGIEYVIAISGDSLMSASGENIGMAAIGLKPWNQRKTRALGIESITADLNKMFADDRQAQVNFFALPSIPGVGTSDGLTFQLNALNPMATSADLAERLDTLLSDLNHDSRFAFAFSPFRADTPHIYLDIDRDKLAYYQVPMSAVLNTLENYFGSRYVNNITLAGQVNKVIIQADYAARHSLQDLNNTYVPAETGALVPLGDFMTMHTVFAPKVLFRYNQYTTAGITAETAPGVSTGTAITAVENTAKSLGKEYQIAWTGISLQEVETQGLAALLMTLAFIFGYLFLVALYESFWIALSVIMTNIFGIAGALLGLKMSGLDLSIYAQLGIVLLIGLASKNAILIVQFTTTYQRAGMPIRQAAEKGAGERFRAVLMTAMTFILGVMPMLFAGGAGAASQVSMGTAVFFGMVVATAFGILFVPAFWTVCDTLATRTWGRKIRATGVCLVCVCLLSGCLMGEDYTRPAFFTDTALEQALDTVSPQSQTPVSDTISLSVFQDPILNTLLDKAQSDNPTVRQALLSVRRARALTTGQTAALFPTLDAAGRYNYVKESQNMGLVFDQDYYQIGFDAAWEADIFGGTRRRIQAAEADARAALAHVAGAVVSVRAETAAMYYTLRQAEMLLQKARENADFQGRSVRLLRDRQSSGIGNDLDVQQATYLWQHTRAAIPQLEQQCAVARHALALLTGQLPGTVDDFISGGPNPMATPHKTFDKTYGDISAEAVRHRPDVRVAEEQLIAQNALAGAALADMFPKVSLSGLLGLESLHLNKLAHRRSYGYSFTPDITTPIFHFGALWENLQAEKIGTEIQREAYRSALLTAAHDVKNALVAIQTERGRNQELYQAYQRAEEAAALTRDEYLNGLVNYSDVIDTEERRLSAQTDWIQSNGQLYQNLIVLYKALGGDPADSSLSVATD